MMEGVIGGNFILYFFRKLLKIGGCLLGIIYDWFLILFRIG